MSAMTAAQRSVRTDGSTARTPAEACHKPREIHRRPPRSYTTHTTISRLPQVANTTRRSRKRQTSPPLPPFGELVELHVSTLILAIMSKHDFVHNIETTEHIALSSEEDRAMDTGNRYRKFGEIWTCGLWDMRADRRTNRQTDRHADRNTSHR